MGGDSKSDGAMAAVGGGGMTVPSNPGPHHAIAVGPVKVSCASGMQTAAASATASFVPATMAELTGGDGDDGDGEIDFDSDGAFPPIWPRVKSMHWSLAGAARRTQNAATDAAPAAPGDANATDGIDEDKVSEDSAATHGLALSPTFDMKLLGYMPKARPSWWTPECGAKRKDPHGEGCVNGDDPATTVGLPLVTGKGAAVAALHRTCPLLWHPSPATPTTSDSHSAGAVSLIEMLEVEIGTGPSGRILTRV
jgi:hypothetical protein